MLAAAPRVAPVFKFGGTSMGSPERIELVAALCAKHRPSCVVVSAMAGETNRLVGLARTLTQRTDTPEYDMLLASGEQVSVALLSMALRARGLEAVPMLAPHAGIRTTADFSRASIQSIDAPTLLSHIRTGVIPVIAGFQGVTEDGQLTTIGRGGSDTSAVAVAAALGAEECVIYTDVDGVFTTDPRIVPHARIISKIHFDEMLEMASQGSKVLHIRSVHLAAKWGVKLVVRNTFTDGKGTEMTQDESIEGELVTGVAASTHETLLTVSGLRYTVDVQGRLFSALAERRVNVDIIAQETNANQNEIQLKFTVGSDDSQVAREAIAQAFPQAKVEVNSDVAKISIVGIGMRVHPGVAARMFTALAKERIDIRLVTTSEIKVACLVDRKNSDAAVRALHAEFLESQ